jgi:reactive intermediate/imine deaminase
VDLPALALPFSWGVRCRDLLFVAGQGPVGRDEKVIPGDIRVHNHATLENLKKVVEAAGSDLGSVVSTTVYLSDLADSAAMNGVYSEYFAKEPRPARATVRADLLLGMKVELQGIAYVPSA